jgi:phosphohistidine swiveling domain-containing protein
VEKHNGKLTKKQFNDLYERFKWLSCLDIHNKPWTKEEFKNHIKSFGKSSKKVAKFDKYAHELKIKADDLNYLLMAQRFVYIKDARDDFRRQGVYFAHNLFADLARRMVLHPEETTYLQEEDILSFLSGKKQNLKSLISERKSGFILYLNKHHQLVCLQGKKIPKILTSFHLLATEEEIKEIKGTIASKGLVKGTVAVIHGVKDLKKVKEGNILIAVTTHPDYVPVMRKAAAIITDEGGITSHAAIVSREFGIPCIVGTKNATRIIHDGDIVEVNANEGWVKKV